MEELTDFIESNRERFIKDLIRLCEKPSVSAQNLGIE